MSQYPEKRWVLFITARVPADEQHVCGEIEQALAQVPALLLGDGAELHAYALTHLGPTDREGSEHPQAEPTVYTTSTPPFERRARERTR